MPEKTVMKYLEDIRDYSQKAINYLNDITYDEFFKDNKTIINKGVRFIYSFTPDCVCRGREFYLYNTYSSFLYFLTVI